MSTAVRLCNHAAAKDRSRPRLRPQVIGLHIHFRRQEQRFYNKAFSPATARRAVAATTSTRRRLTHCQPTSCWPQGQQLRAGGRRESDSIRTISVYLFLSNQLDMFMLFFAMFCHN